MKEHWKVDKYVKVVSKVERDKFTPIKVDLQPQLSISQLQPNDDFSKKILTFLRILILIVCLSLLTWFSIRFYNEYNMPNQTQVSEIIVEEDSIEYIDWIQEVNQDLYSTTLENNFFLKLIPIVISEDSYDEKLNLAIAGTISLIKSLNILEKHSLDLTRDTWICQLLNNEKDAMRIYILEFIKVSKPSRSAVEDNTNCTEVNENKKNSTDEDTSDSFPKASIIVDSDANLLFAKYLEPRIGDVFKLLLWYLQNYNSQYFERNETDVKVLAAKILFDTDIINYRETLDHLRTIIEQNKNYQNDNEKLLNGTLGNFEADTMFQVIMMERLYIKAAAERLYADEIINAETLTYVLPIENEIAKDYYISSFGEEYPEDTDAQ